QANAAVALLRMNQMERGWPLLKHSSDPSARSWLIHRLGPLDADVGTLVKRLAEEPDLSICRALVLSLGPEQFADEAWTVAKKNQMVVQLQEIYQTADDPGLHAAAEWLLKQWHEDEWLRRINDTWAKDKNQRDYRLERIRKQLAGPEALAPGER